MNAAQRIIDKCGGVDAVAKMAGVDRSNVHRWTYPKGKGGTDGAVPTRHQQKILDEARRRGINLTPADFFGCEDDPCDDEPSEHTSTDSVHHGG